MFATGISRSFTARHALRGDFGPESVPHSHPYRIEWICRTPVLDGNGFSVDISLQERVLEDVLDSIDDRLLNDLPYFRDRQPSLENLAVYLSDHLRQRVARKGGDPSGIEEQEVRIWESETAWASYTSRAQEKAR